MFTRRTFARLAASSKRFYSSQERKEYFKLGSVLTAYLAGLYYFQSDHFLNWCVTRIVSSVLDNQNKEEDELYFEKIQYERVTGCLLCGGMTFNNLHIVANKKGDDEDLHMDTKFEQVNVIIPWTSMLRAWWDKEYNQVTIPLAHFYGLRMNMERNEHELQAMKDKQGRVKYSIADFRVDDAIVSIKTYQQDRALLKANELVLNRLHVIDVFHFDRAFYDLAFRSIVHGTLDTFPFKIELYHPKGNVKQEDMDLQEILAEMSSVWDLPPMPFLVLYQLLFPIAAKSLAGDAINFLLSEYLQSGLFGFELELKPNANNKNMVDIAWNVKIRNAHIEKPNWDDAWKMATEKDLSSAALYRLAFSAVPATVIDSLNALRNSDHAMQLSFAKNDLWYKKTKQEMLQILFRAIAAKVTSKNKE